MKNAGMHSGATDVFRPAGLIRAGRLLPEGRRIPDSGHVPRTDEPYEAQATSVAPNFLQPPHNGHALSVQVLLDYLSCGVLRQFFQEDELLGHLIFG
jgi:hypothetical protein